MKTILLTLLLVFNQNFAMVTDSVRSNVKLVLAQKTEENIDIDGELSEQIWNFGYKITGLIQKDPYEGKNASEKTEIFVAYNDEDLFIAAHLYDSNPDSIVARLARKDAFVNSDLFFVALDPYLDRRSGYYFGISPSGTLYDGILFNDSWEDDSWDGVWEAKAKITKDGWTVEMKIPFSQLRFKEESELTWGINFRRDISRKNESDYLVHIPKTEGGFVSHFLLLEGLKNIKPSKQFEILPYITSRAEYSKPVNGNPFHTGSNFTPGAGADIKVALGSNLTLNTSVNPDFGQVEIDPAVINLTDVETFFTEKRPFFIEGASIFNFGQGGARNYWSFNWSNPRFFYSRRIGRNPSGSTPEAAYVDYPEGTHILGAAKLTGKVLDNWNIGTIQSITSRESAVIKTDNLISTTEVEPLAYYGIVRVQKEINSGMQGIGFINTIALRKINEKRLLDEFNSSSVVTGIDGWIFLDSSQTWVFAGWLGFSRDAGSEERILSLQKSSARYFQRPDSKNLSIDSSATSLSGSAVRFVLNKQKGNFFFNSAFGLISPGFDVNDLGFLSRSDIINWHLGAGYSWTEPGKIFRSAELGAAVFQNYDFDGNKTFEGIFHFGFAQFLNYYSFNWNLAYYPETLNNRLTRGGPLSINPKAYQVNLNINSDQKNKFVFGIGGAKQWTNTSNFYSAYFQIEIHPVPNIFISVSPSFDVNNDFAQYIGTFTDTYAKTTYGKRYIFGELDQKTFSAGIRLNWTFTPNLSLQLYAQPLISSGKYKNIKELAEGSSYQFNIFGQNNSSFDYDNYIADPDGSGPAPQISIGNPNFNFISLRGNAVLRWEYLPGSTLFFVWTQNRNDFENDGEFRFGKSLNKLFNLHPDNIFMVKFTYWFNI